MPKITRFIIIVTGIFLNVFLVVSSYYFLFYKPIKSNKEVNFLEQFREISLPLEQFSEIPLPPPEIFPADKAITAEEIIPLLGKKPIYFIHMDEREVFERIHIKGSVNIREGDITSFKDIQEALELNDREAEEALFVIYCFQGYRTQGKAAWLDMPNVKFLAGGISGLAQEGKDFALPVVLTSSQLLDSDIQNHDFTITVSKALELMKTGETRFIDVGSLAFRDNIFPFVYYFQFKSLSTEEYHRRLSVILGWKGQDIVFIVARPGDFALAKLLIQRLVREHGFKRDKFFMLLGEINAFYRALLEEGLIQRE